MQTNTAKQQLMEIAARIKEMREIMGWSIAQMAEKTEVTEQQYTDYENAIIAGGILGSLFTIFQPKVSVLGVTGLLLFGFLIVLKCS